MLIYDQRAAFCREGCFITFFSKFYEFSFATPHTMRKYAGFELYLIFKVTFLTFTGISRDEVFQNLSSKMSKGDVDQALEFLSNEGHVYSTTDEDHFKTTDS